MATGTPMPPPTLLRPGVQPGQPFQTGQSTGQIGKVPGSAGGPAMPAPARSATPGQPVRPGVAQPLQPAVRPGAQPGQPVRPGVAQPGQVGTRPPAGQAPHAPTAPVQPNHGSTGARPPAVPAGKRPVGKGKVRQTAKQAHLRVTKLDLLAVLKMSFLFGFSVSLIMFVGGFALWHLLLLSGAIDSAQNLINSVLGNPATGGAANLQLGQYLNSTRVTGFFAGIAVINVFILTLLGTVFGALYNLASTLFGGIEVTLEV